jgi:hypothetical protein
MIEQTYGTCRICSKSYKKAGMQRHVRACRAKRVGPGAGDGLLLAIEDRYLPSYWLVAEASPTVTWEDLDAFLRRIWVECCGHMSCFEVAGDTFVYDVDDASEWADDPRSMEELVADALAPGDRFTYEYDFGTTTELVGRALDTVPGAPERPAIGVLARNEMPVHRCAVCGHSATRVCALCHQVTDDDCWYCDACSEGHRCQDPQGEYFLPVVNSPRVGLCGYGGPAEG